MDWVVWPSNAARGNFRHNGGRRSGHEAGEMSFSGLKHNEHVHGIDERIPHSRMEDLGRVTLGLWCIKICTP